MVNSHHGHGPADTAQKESLKLTPMPSLSQLDHGYISAAAAVDRDEGITAVDGALVQLLWTEIRAQLPWTGLRAQLLWVGLREQLLWTGLRCRPQDEAGSFPCVMGVRGCQNSGVWPTLTWPRSARNKVLPGLELPGDQDLEVRDRPGLSKGLNLEGRYPEGQP